MSNLDFKSTLIGLLIACVAFLLMGAGGKRPGFGAYTGIEVNGKLHILNQYTGQVHIDTSPVKWDANPVGRSCPQGRTGYGCNPRN